MSASQTYRLGFIGAGKLAGSVIRGLMRAKFCPPNEIIASEPNEETRTALQSETNIILTAENAEVAEKADTVFIAVKPPMVLPVLTELKDKLQNKLVVSLAGGVRIASMEKVCDARIMRALTNTPSAICRAATGIARGSRSTNNDVDLTKKIFGAVGVVVEIEESQIDIVTALSGSGPAFIYTVIEALAAGGTKLGLANDVAMELAIQTARGAADIMLESKMSPEELRRMVVTPGGTTAAGLAVMEKLGTSESLIAAVEAATKRGQEMARENR
ncbi:MAG TPA: pyrroline-5-carboxylate reductase [Chthoniobacterales bacterium]|jgi:pyrroline-5-carboxylate reductase|nr:pyrroline-5-carboxylate reductase [Chthoniobacterales bacterium]